MQLFQLAGGHVRELAEPAVAVQGSR
jgi:hypothetical protein